MYKPSPTPSGASKFESYLIMIFFLWHDLEYAAELSAERQRLPPASFDSAAPPS